MYNMKPVQNQGKSLAEMDFQSWLLLEMECPGNVIETRRFDRHCSWKQLPSCENTKQDQKTKQGKSLNMISCQKYHLINATR